MKNRKQSRADLYLRLPVYRDEDTEPLGYMQNISTGGLMVVSDHLIPLDLSMTLRLRLPESFDGVDEIRFRARPVWKEADMNPLLTTTGFKFEELAFSDYQIIHALIPRYSTRTLTEGDAVLA